MTTVFRRLYTFEDERWRSTMKRLSTKGIIYQTEFFEPGVSIVVIDPPHVYQRFLGHLNFEIVEVAE